MRTVERNTTALGKQVRTSLPCGVLCSHSRTAPLNFLMPATSAGALNFVTPRVLGDCSQSKRDKMLDTQAPLSA